MTDYVELHCRSAFSFLRGASTPEQLAERAAQLQLSAVALCDRDGVYGAPRFFGRARELGIRPIVGAELTMTDGAILPVLVQSRHGYENLCQLLTRAHLRNQKGQCSVLWDDLPEFAEGLVACANATVFGSARVSRPVFSVPPKTPAGQSSADENQSGERRFAGDTRTDTGDARAPRSIEKLLGAFGRENVFIEIHRHRIRGEEKAVRSMIQLAGHFHVPLLATNGVLYSTENERPVLDVFTCIRHHTHLDAAGKLLEQNGEQYLKSAAQMRDLFRDLPEAIENTVHLAERLDFTLENLGYEFPKFITPNGEPMELYLREMTFAGARKRYPNGIPDKVKSQLEHELHLINRLGFAGYFLIVWDIVKFCRENKIMAQGRGSAANSAVCFCLHITAVDPVEVSNFCSSDF